MTKCQNATTPFPPVDKQKIWVGGRFSSLLSYQFPPFPPSSDLCSSSYPSPTSPFFSHIRLKLNSSLCILLSTSFYRQNLPLELPLSQYLCTHIHLRLHFRTPLPHDGSTPLHLNLCLLSFHFFIISISISLFLMTFVLLFIFIFIFTLIFISVHFIFRFLFLFLLFFLYILLTYIFLTITSIQTTGCT